MKIGQEAGEKGTSEHNSFKQILGIKAVHYLAFFILVYVGVEVTIGGAYSLFFSSQLSSEGYTVRTLLRLNSVVSRVDRHFYA